jgi:hypothetical protein
MDVMAFLYGLWSVCLQYWLNSGDDDRWMERLSQSHSDESSEAASSSSVCICFMAV